MKKLEDATNNTKTWKHKVAEHEGMLRLIQPGNNGTNNTVCLLLSLGGPIWVLGQKMKMKTLSVQVS